MVRYTNMTFTLPSVEEFKQLLYDNDIGYQTTPEGKLYVRRFYLIPQLLFSRDIIDTKVVRGTDRQQEAAELLKDMRGARSLRSPTNGAVSVDPRALDKLFAIKDSDRDAADVDDPSSLKNSKTVLSPGALKAKRDEAVAAIAEIAKEEDESNDHKLLVDTPEWSKVLDRHNVKLPTTDLERERDELFASQEAFRLEESTSESEVYQFRRTRFI